MQKINQVKDDDADVKNAKNYFDLGKEKKLDKMIEKVEKQQNQPKPPKEPKEPKTV